MYVHNEVELSDVLCVTFFHNISLVEMIKKKLTLKFTCEKLP